MNSIVDPQLKTIHNATLNLYNRETLLIKSHPTSTVSINATNFLVGQANLFADSALFLMEDDRQPLNPAVALLRTCLEAQARANYIIAVTGEERERRANEFLQLMNVGHDYNKALVIQMMKDFGTDPSKFLPRELPYLPAIKLLLENTDTSNLKALKSQYDKMSGNWSYGKVIGREKLLDPIWQKRSEAQSLQLGLYLSYIQSCAFVHSDPASLKLEPLLTPVDVAYTTVTAEVAALFSFFVALGKDKDQDLLNITASLKAFNIHEKILPSKDLPPS
jgi:hypothetical protein